MRRAIDNVPTKTGNTTINQTLRTFWIIAVVTVGIILRLRHVLVDALWHDEIFTLEVVTSSWPTFREFVFTGTDIHPPFYYLFLRVLAAFLPGTDPESALRILNIGSFAIYVFGFRIWGMATSRWSAPLVALTAIAVSPGLAYLGAELRMYSLAPALVFLILTMLIAWEALPAARGRGRAIAMGLIAASAALSHYFAAIMVLALAVGWWIVFRKKIAKASVAIGAGVAASLVAFSPVVAKHLSHGLGYNRTVMDSVGFVYWTVGLAGVAALLAGVWNQTTSERSQSPTARALLLTIGGVLTLAMLSLWFRDSNILTFGSASILAPLIIVLGAVRSRGSTRLLAFIAGFAALSTVVAWQAMAQPTTFEPNRISTVKALADYLDIDPEFSTDSGSRLIVIHADSNVANTYFEAHLPDRIERATVLTFDAWGAHPPDLLQPVFQSLSPNQTVFLVTRIQRSLQWIPPDYHHVLISPAVYRILPNDP